MEERKGHPGRLTLSGKGLYFLYHNIASPHPPALSKPFSLSPYDPPEPWGREIRPLEPSDYQGVLRRCQLFDTLSDEELEQIQLLCSHRSYGPSENLYDQGGRSDTLYIIADGAVALLRSRAGQAEINIDILTANCAFGWSCLIEPHVHTLTARALRRTEVITIPGPPLRAVLEGSPQAGFEVMQKLAILLANRLRALYAIVDTWL